MSNKTIHKRRKHVRLKDIMKKTKGDWDLEKPNVKQLKGARIDV